MQLLKTQYLTLFWSYFDRSNAVVLPSIDLRQWKRNRMLVAPPQEENGYGEASEMVGQIFQCCWRRWGWIG
jgi:hypothetical protein